MNQGTTIRLAEIRRRLQQLDAEHRGRDLPAEARAEVERLEGELERLHLGEER